MRRLVPLVLLPAIALGGCAALGGKQKAPDEFQVARNAPLVIPPDYTLTPPVAGTAALSPTDAQQQAIDALFGGPAPRSRSEMNMLEKAGRDRTQIGARSTAGDPDTRVVDKGPVTMAILNAPQADSEVATAQVPQ
ncbi:MAG TPA: DUF3035 domain-containing protein [Sphingomicrobium sp.]